MESPLVQIALKRQKPDGRWGRRRRAYGETVWRLLFLALVGAQANAAIRRGCEYVITGGQLENGGFSCNEDITGILPCFTANAVHFLTAFGYADDPRLHRAVEYLAKHPLDEGGWLCIGRVKKSSSCFWATAKVLRAFSALPSSLRTSEVQAAEHRAVDMLLNAGLYQSNPRDWGGPHPHWFLVGFPLLLESDILEVLSLVAPYVTPDEPRIQAGLNLILDKQDIAGRWPLEKTIYMRSTGEIKWQVADETGRRRLISRRHDPTVVELIGRLGQPNEWVTLNVLRMLKRLYSDR